MALTEGDLIQIVDVQTYLGQQLLNVYYYRAGNDNVEGVEALEGLADYFRVAMLGDIHLIQASNLLHTQRQLKNLSNGIDFFVDTEVVAGGMSTGTSDAGPSFISAGFMLVRSSLVTRNGYKRIGGLVEAAYAGNTSTLSETNIDAICEEMADAPITVPEDQFFPVIVKRPIPAPGGGAYLYSDVSSVQFRGIGTQNTRKPGRGV